MATSPLAGQPAPTEMLVDLARLEREYHERKPDVGDPDQLVAFGTSGHRGTSLRRHVHRGAHPGHHPGDLRVPARPGDRRPALSWARTRTPCPARPSARRWRCWRPTASRRSSSSDDGVTPTPVISHAILRPQPRPRGAAWPTASSSRRRTTRPRTAASSTTRPTAARPTPTSPSWIQDRANELLRARQRRRQARAATPHALKAADARTGRLRPPYVDDLASVIDMDAIRGAGLKLGVDPLGGAARRTTGSRSTRRYGLDLTVVNPVLDPTLRVHDGRPRRQDPHGLLQPVRDGAAWSG